MNMSSGYKRPGIFTELLHLTSCASLGNLFKPQPHFSLFPI